MGGKGARDRKNGGNMGGSNITRRHDDHKMKGKRRVMIIITSICRFKTRRKKGKRRKCKSKGIFFFPS